MVYSYNLLSFTTVSTVDFAKAHSHGESTIGTPSGFYAMCSKQCPLLLNKYVNKALVFSSNP